MACRQGWMRARNSGLTALALLVGACGGGGSGLPGSGSSSSGGGPVPMCANLPLANAVLGQSSFTSGAPNSGGISASTVSGALGSAGGNGSGPFYVADTANNRVLGYNSAPAASGGAADFVLGQPDAATVTSSTGAHDGSPFGLNHPAKAWVDSSGSYLVVSDRGNSRVLIWHPLPTSNTAPGIVIGQADLSGGASNQGNSAPSASTLSGPAGSAIAGGKLIVADTGNSRVLIWNTLPASGQAADLVLGQNDFTSGTGGTVDQFNNATQTYSLRLNQPGDAWSDGSHLLVADTANNRVLYWATMPTTQNQLANNVLGVDKFGDSAPPGGDGGLSGFAFPAAVASDGADVLVADSVNNRVLRFASYLAAPSNDKAADDVFGQASFTNVQRDDPDQNGTAGDQSTDPNGSGITAGTLDTPTGLVILPGGQFWVSDSGNARLLRFATASGVNGAEPQVPCGK